MHIFLRYGLLMIVVGAVIMALVAFLLPGVLSSSGGMFAVVFGFATFGLFYIAVFGSITAAIFGYMEGHAESGKEEALAHAKQRFWKILVRFITFLFVLILLFGFIGGLFSVIIASMFGLLGGGLEFLFVLALYVGIFYISTKVYLAPYIYANNYLEQRTILDSIEESFRLTDGKWWYTFGSQFVVSMICMVLLIILLLPFYFLMFLPLFFGVESGFSGMFQGGAILASLIPLAGFLFIIMITSMLMPFLYYSLHDLKYGDSIDSRIDDITFKKDSFFENEGEL